VVLRALCGGNGVFTLPGPCKTRMGSGVIHAPLLRVECSVALRALCVAGNGGSLDKCRRRWDLADREDLRYKFMNSFDRAMNHLDKAFGFIGAPHTCAAATVLSWQLYILACSRPRDV